MDPEHSAQDLMRCDVCETPIPALFCDICHKNLCKSCAGEHLLDGSKEHKVVPFEQRGSTTKCQKHSTKICELYCELCSIPLCSHCISSKAHNNHDIVDILKGLFAKKNVIQQDLKELEKNIFPEYQKAASELLIQKSDVRKHYQKLSTALNKQRQTLHHEVDVAFQRLQSYIDDADSKHLVVIDHEESAINNKIKEIEQLIADMKTMLASDDFFFVSAYKSRNGEFMKLPAQSQITLPTFTPYKINRELINHQLGSWSKLVIRKEENTSRVRTPVIASSPPARPLIVESRILTDIKTTCGSLSKLASATEKHCELMQTTGVVSSPLARPLLDKPRILREIQTDFGEDNGLRSVSCLNDQELWTCGQDKIMRLYNLHGKLLKSVQTKSGTRPREIAITKSSNLVYTDPSPNNTSIKIVKNAQIELLVSLRGWLPLYLCSTSSGDLLVTMISDSMRQTKVVRYSGSTEKQSIQWDDQGQPLFSSDPKNVIKYLSENRNSDICVADCYGRVIVVVSAVGKLRFRYTGLLSSKKEPFNPVGIATDSQSRILTADNSHRVHILDRDGKFLRFIDNCGLQLPYGLCVDSNDNLFVAEHVTGKLKKIQYYK